MKLYAHPFSAYSQKVLTALYENGAPFEFAMLSPEHPQVGAEFATLWPMRRFPVLVDEGRTVLESSVIIEYLDLFHRGSAPMIPEDRRAALDVRMLDRFFDNYVMTPTQKIVGDRLRAQAVRDPHGVEEAKQMLEVAYRWLDERMQEREWAAGDAFSLADCAAAPSLFYADWVHPIDRSLRHAHGYRQRLLARPSFARAVDQARPYRSLFPLGAPDRD
ncbi:glutathione S-transferase family protein [Trinickia sp. Y13]|uniref:glutathione S-transferase family protein n=1 Tax=Trinickia sp. Y13 TaxID=2917807 RepID=UPI002404FB3B|nr:glutathione S-transferase family protein [Trinickia sp. Y13]MDG0027557.1 glutathione S-transferase family protein [Trinickia sp. Y13]